MARSRAPIGDNLARLRRQRELTQEGLAERAGISVDLVKKLEQHQRDSARLTTLESLANALDVALSELTRAPTPAATTATTQPPEASTRIQIPHSRRSGATMGDMDADDLEAIRRTSAQLVELDTRHGSAGLDQFGVRAFTEARGRLATAHGPTGLVADLADAVAELGQISAWLLHDAGRTNAARSTLAEALTIAGTTGDHSRHAPLMIVDQLSMLATWSGAWAEGMRFAERGLALAARTAPRSTRIAALCRLRHGRALARGGHDAGLAEIRQATAMLSDGTRDDDPSWAWWIDVPQIAIHHAMAASNTGAHTQAVDLALTSVADLNSHQRRDHATFRTNLLHIAVCAGAWQEAVDVASELAILLPTVGSERGINAVRSVASRMARYPGQTPSSVVDAIQALLSATGTPCPPSCG